MWLVDCLVGWLLSRLAHWMNCYQGFSLVRGIANWLLAIGSMAGDLRFEYRFMGDGWVMERVMGG